jgi:hypothetical protein
MKPTKVTTEVASTVASYSGCSDFCDLSLHLTAKINYAT